MKEGRHKKVPSQEDRKPVPGVGTMWYKAKAFWMKGLGRLLGKEKTEGENENKWGRWVGGEFYRAL